MSSNIPPKNNKKKEKIKTNANLLSSCLEEQEKPSISEEQEKSSISEEMNNTSYVYPKNVSDQPPTIAEAPTKFEGTQNSIPKKSNEHFSSGQARQRPDRYSRSKPYVPKYEGKLIESVGFNENQFKDSMTTKEKLFQKDPERYFNTINSDVNIRYLDNISVKINVLITSYVRANHLVLVPEVESFVVKGLNFLLSKNNEKFEKKSSFEEFLMGPLLKNKLIKELFNISQNMTNINYSDNNLNESRDIISSFIWDFMLKEKETIYKTTERKDLQQRLMSELSNFCYEKSLPFAYINANEYLTVMRSREFYTKSIKTRLSNQWDSLMTAIDAKKLPPNDPNEYLKEIFYDIKGCFKYTSNLNQMFLNLIDKFNITIPTFPDKKMFIKELSGDKSNIFDNILSHGLNFLTNQSKTLFKYFITFTNYLLSLFPHTGMNFTSFEDLFKIETPDVLLKDLPECCLTAIVDLLKQATSSRNKFVEMNLLVMKSIFKIKQEELIKKLYIISKDNRNVYLGIFTSLVIVYRALEIKLESEGQVNQLSSVNQLLDKYPLQLDSYQINSFNPIQSLIEALDMNEMKIKKGEDIQSIEKLNFGSYISIIANSNSINLYLAQIEDSFKIHFKRDNEDFNSDIDLNHFEFTLDEEIVNLWKKLFRDQLESILTDLPTFQTFSLVGLLLEIEKEMNKIDESISQANKCYGIVHLLNNVLKEDDNFTTDWNTFCYRFLSDSFQALGGHNHQNNILQADTSDIDSFKIVHAPSLSFEMKKRIFNKFYDPSIISQVDFQEKISNYLIQAFGISKDQSKEISKEIEISHINEFKNDEMKETKQKSNIILPNYPKTSENKHNFTVHKLFLSINPFSYGSSLKECLNWKFYQSFFDLSMYSQTKFINFILSNEKILESSGIQLYTSFDHDDMIILPNILTSENLQTIFQSNLDNITLSSYLLSYQVVKMENFNKDSSFLDDFHHSFKAFFEGKRNEQDSLLELTMTLSLGLPNHIGCIEIFSTLFDVVLSNLFNNQLKETISCFINYLTFRNIKEYFFLFYSFINQSSLCEKEFKNKCLSELLDKIQDLNSPREELIKEEKAFTQVNTEVQIKDNSGPVSFPKDLVFSEIIVQNTIYDGLDPKSFVNKLLQDEFRYDEALNRPTIETPDSKKLKKSLDLLAKNLYSSDVHFVMELIQNSDDNTYDKNIKPTIIFDLNPPDSSNSLIIYNNEKGFSKENIRAICNVGGSTKKNIEGYIGQKGIGFKSVFSISDRPEVHSNGFHIGFDKEISMIEPIWISDSLLGPRNVEYSTCLKLPLSPLVQANMSKLIMNLAEVFEGKLILFLNKIQYMEFNNFSTNERIFHSKELLTNNWISITACKKSSVEETFWLIENEVLTNPPVTRDSHLITKSVVSLGFKFKKASEIYKINDSDSNNEQEDDDGFEIVSNEESHSDDLIEINTKKNVILQLDFSEELLPIYAYLPTSIFCFPFIVQGDFLLSTSRENIKGDNDWNRYLLRQIPRLYAKLIEELADWAWGNREKCPRLKQIIDFKDENNNLYDFEIKYLDILKLIPLISNCKINKECEYLAHDIYKLLSDIPFLPDLSGRRMEPKYLYSTYHLTFSINELIPLELYEKYIFPITQKHFADPDVVLDDSTAKSLQLSPLNDQVIMYFFEILHNVITKESTERTLQDFEISELYTLMARLLVMLKLLTNKETKKSDIHKLRNLSLWPVVNESNEITFLSLEKNVLYINDERSSKLTPAQLNCMKYFSRRPLIIDSKFLQINISNLLPNLTLKDIILQFFSVIGNNNGIDITKPVSILNSCIISNYKTINYENSEEYDTSSRLSFAAQMAFVFLCKNDSEIMASLPKILYSPVFELQGDSSSNEVAWKATQIIKIERSNLPLKQSDIVYLGFEIPTSCINILSLNPSLTTHLIQMERKIVDPLVYAFVMNNETVIKEISSRDKLSFKEIMELIDFNASSKSLKNDWKDFLYKYHVFNSIGLNRENNLPENKLSDTFFPLIERILNTFQTFSTQEHTNMNILSDLPNYLPLCLPEPNLWKGYSGVYASENMVTIFYQLIACFYRDYLDIRKSLTESKSNSYSLDFLSQKAVQLPWYPVDITISLPSYPKLIPEDKFILLSPANILCRDTADQEKNILPVDAHFVYSTSISRFVLDTFNLKLSDINSFYFKNQVSSLNKPTPELVKVYFNWRSHLNPDQIIISRVEFYDWILSYAIKLVDRNQEIKSLFQTIIEKDLPVIWIPQDNIDADVNLLGKMYKFSQLVMKWPSKYLVQRESKIKAMETYYSRSLAYFKIQDKCSNCVKEEGYLGYYGYHQNTLCGCKISNQFFYPQFKGKLERGLIRDTFNASDWAEFIGERVDDSSDETLALTSLLTLSNLIWESIDIQTPLHPFSIDQINKMVENGLYFPLKNFSGDANHEFIRLSLNSKKENMFVCDDVELLPYLSQINSEINWIDPLNDLNERNNLIEPFVYAQKNCKVSNPLSLTSDFSNFHPQIKFVPQNILPLLNLFEVKFLSNHTTTTISSIENAESKKETEEMSKVFKILLESLPSKFEKFEEEKKLQKDLFRNMTKYSDRMKALPRVIFKINSSVNLQLDIQPDSKDLFPSEFTNTTFSVNSYRPNRLYEPTVTFSDKRDIFYLSLSIEKTKRIEIMTKFIFDMLHFEMVYLDPLVSEDVFKDLKQFLEYSGRKAYLDKYSLEDILKVQELTQTTNFDDWKFYDEIKINETNEKQFNKNHEKKPLEFDSESEGEEESNLKFDEKFIQDSTNYNSNFKKRDPANPNTNEKPKEFSIYSIGKISLQDDSTISPAPSSNQSFPYHPYLSTSESDPNHEGNPDRENHHHATPIRHHQKTVSFDLFSLPKREINQSIVNEMATNISFGTLYPEEILDLNNYVSVEEVEENKTEEEVSSLDLVETSNATIGRIGEKIAYKYLQKLSEKQNVNWKITWLNEMSESGESYDLIIEQNQDSQTLQKFIEVKSRQLTNDKEFIKVWPFSPSEVESIISLGQNYACLLVTLKPDKSFEQIRLVGWEKGLSYSLYSGQSKLLLQV